MNRQTIAAIIPLFNGKRFIVRAVESVLSQTRPPDEILVIDDGSTDEGLQIAQSVATALPVRLISKVNGGQSSARNMGVARSSSSLVAFLDQDDVWYPGHLAELEKPFRGGDAETLGWSYSNLDEGDVDGVLRTPRFLQTRDGHHPKSSIQDCLAHDMFILPSASLIARNAFETVGGFDEQLSGYEDDDLFVRLLAAGFRHRYVDRSLSMWCIHGTSATSLPSMSRSRMIYARKVLDRFGTMPVEGGTIASVAIVPRFSRSLWGEYIRAAQRDDRDRMQTALEDLRALVLPEASPPMRLGLRVGLVFLSVPWLRRLVTSPRATSILRRSYGLTGPKPNSGLTVSGR